MVVVVQEDAELAISYEKTQIYKYIDSHCSCKTTGGWMISFWTATERKGLNRDVWETEEALCNEVNSPGRGASGHPCVRPPLVWQGGQNLCLGALDPWSHHDSVPNHIAWSFAWEQGVQAAPRGHTPAFLQEAAWAQQASSLMTGDAECPSLGLLWRNAYSGTLPLFNWVTSFQSALFWSCMNSFHSLIISPLADKSFANVLPIP